MRPPPRKGMYAAVLRWRLGGVCAVFLTFICKGLFAFHTRQCKGRHSSYAATLESQSFKIMVVSMEEYERRLFCHEVVRYTTPGSYSPSRIQQ